MYFQYDDVALEHLKRKDKKLAGVIDRLGKIERHVNPDMFVSVVRAIIGQQISSAAQATIYQRLEDKIKVINADTILSLSADDLQSVGISYKKADYIQGFAQAVQDGRLDLAALAQMSDDDVIATLTTIRGIGVWTAQMLLIFCLGRPDVLSFGDLAILRGMRMLYRHRTIDKARFERYQKRYRPYGSVASFYLWAVAGGAMAELSDPAINTAKK